MKIAIVVHHNRPLAHELARESAEWLQSAGHSVVLPGDDADVSQLGYLGVDESALSGDVDVMVSLGGDGTMLRSVQYAGDAGTPILGVNIGQLGYLTHIEPGELRPALGRVLDGSFGVEERMTLAIECRGTMHRALNEAVVEKNRLGHTVRLAVSFDDEYFATYAADGLIVATPTGSTAYSLSARGPIVSPIHRALVFTPVSPHMLFDRSIVLDPTSTVRLENAGERPAALSIDGRNMADDLERGEVIKITSGQHPVRLVTLDHRNFHSILKAKFGLPDR